MKSITMNSKERVKAASTFKPTDRPPFNFWMDRRLMAQYEELYGQNFRVARYDADVVETFPNIPFPAGKGVFESGSYWILEPLLKDMSKASELELPDPDKIDVCQFIRTDIERFPDKFILMDMGGVFGIMDNIRGPENFLMDIYDHPNELRDLLERISDILVRVVEKACELPIDAVYTMDDIGTTKGLFASPQMTKEWVLDYNKKYVDVALAAGKPVWMHSDGNIMDALDIIVDMGVTVINPLEPKLNDLEHFKQKYHVEQKLAIYGGLDTYGIIPYGSIEEVRCHVRDTYDLFGKNGGLIFSTHDIPLDCPPENLEALVDEIKRCG